MPLHSIRPGETLFSIAKKNHTSVAQLARANHIADPSRIKAGTTLRFPDHFERRQPAPRAAASQAQTPSRTRQSTAGRTARQTTGTTATREAAPGTGSPLMRRLATAGRATGTAMWNARHKAGKCAEGVHRAIQSAMGIRLSGNGNSTHFPADHFREVHMTLEQALRTPGLVLTWQKTPTRAGQKYGHIAITSGDGRSSSSDFVERDTLAASRGRTGLRIFQPIG